MSFFFRRLWRRCRRADREDRLQLIFYTRQGCHLCEAAWEQLEQARRRYPFELSAVDVDGDPALAAQYGEQVPVVLVNGKVRFRGTVNGVLLERLLRAET